MTEQPNVHRALARMREAALLRPRSPLGAFARLLLGLIASIFVGWLAGEVWLSVVGTTELDAMRDLAADRSGAVTAAARVVTWAGSAWLLAPLGAVFCAVLCWRGRHRDGLVPLAALAGAMLLSISIKALVDRPRPPVEHLQAVGGPSFPSGHATQASAFWLSLVLVGSSRPVGTRALAIVLVLAVASSRVWLGVHYPSDVIAGLGLGTAWAGWTRRTIGATPRRACDPSHRHTR